MIMLDHLLQRQDWPLSLARYDRTPLSEQELFLIETVLDLQARRKTWFPTAQAELSRLVTPVVDALDLFDTQPKYRNSLLASWLEGQLTSQQIFWEWEPERWRETYQLIRLRRQQGKIYYRLNHFLNTAYLLVGFAEFDRFDGFDALRLAQVVFGDTGDEENLDLITQTLVEAGVNAGWCQRWLPRELAALYLKAYRRDLTAITLDRVHSLYERRRHRFRRLACVRIAFALHRMGILPEGLEPTYQPLTAKTVIEQSRQGIAQVWLEWVDRWVQHSSFTVKTRQMHYRCLLQVGRWLTHEHPSITTPDQWTRDLAVTFVAAVDRLKVGDWAQWQYKRKQGQPVSANTKSRLLAVVRAFFTDLQEWEWLPRRFDPQRCLAVPRSIQGLLGPQPRPIDPAFWKKLVIAALNLKVENLAAEAGLHYPLAMVKAMAVVWVFSGLRPDEIRRLRVNSLQYADDSSGSTPVCWLEVPANKRNPVYTKPVDRVIGEVISAWQRQRPSTPMRTDPKTGQRVDFLFDYGGQYIGQQYLACTLIPLLCRAAGVPETDSYGAITPNRARHTIAYQLANGRDPMPLLELQAWMGHKTPDTTLHYTSRSPLELSQTLEQYATRAMRLATVLVDRQAVETGDAARGAPWKFYDVGPGYCTNDFFETCPHRIACARCASYVPKHSATAQWQETQSHLLRMREAIPLTEEMMAALDEGLEAIQKLLDRLVDTPTLSGATPRDLGTTDERELNLILLKDIPVRRD